MQTTGTKIALKHRINNNFMGRKKIQIDRVSDDKIRHVTFKKRRLGLLRKSMELSRLTGALVQLKVFWHEDKSFVEYYSQEESLLNDFVKESPEVNEFAKFFNQHYEFLVQVEDRSNCPYTGEVSDKYWAAQVRNKSDQLEIECKNIAELFSLARKPNYQVNENENLHVMMTEM